MPFDSTDYTPANAEEIRILDGMARRLATPETWCKGAICRHGKGGVERMCLYGALNAEDHGTAEWFTEALAPEFATEFARRVEKVMERVIDQRMGWQPGIAAFNDIHGHTGAINLIREVRAVFAGEHVDAV